MKHKKIITVFGATGAQGGGLARAILNDKKSEFAVRAITRNVNSDKAKELERRGAEVMAGNIDDFKSLQQSLAGAYGAYFVTFFWSHFSAEKETTGAKMMAEAAKEAGLRHAIWSTLEDTRKWMPLDDDRMPTLQGNYKLPHFDGKGEANHYFNDFGVPTTFFLPSFYWENLIYFGSGPKRDAEGKLAITFPMGDKKIAGIAAEDIGKCAYTIFKKGSELIGKTIGVAGDHITCRQMADKLTDALGEEVYYNELTPDQYRGLGFPAAPELGNMFQFYRDFETECLSVRSVKVSKELNPELQSFEGWLSKNAQLIPVDQLETS